MGLMLCVGMVLEAVEIAQFFNLVALKIFCVVEVINGWRSSVVSSDEARCEGRGVCDTNLVGEEENDEISTVGVGIAFTNEISMARS